MAVTTVDDGYLTPRVASTGGEQDHASVPIAAAALEAALQARAPALHASTPLVRKLALRVSRRLDLDETQELMVDACAQLRDIGMIGLPDEVILNTGRLSPARLGVAEPPPRAWRRAALRAPGHGRRRRARAGPPRAMGR